MSDEVAASSASRRRRRGRGQRVLLRWSARPSPSRRRPRRGPAPRRSGGRSRSRPRRAPARRADRVDDLRHQHHAGDLAGVAAGLVALGDHDVHAAVHVDRGRARPCRPAPRPACRARGRASMTSGGGGPSALAISRAGWASATSTCWRATECSQPSTPSPARRAVGQRRHAELEQRLLDEVPVAGRDQRAQVGRGALGGHAWRASPRRRRRAGRRCCASIQARTASSSAGSLKRTQPSTPRPPARLIAAATCSDGVKPTIGCSMPSTVAQRRPHGSPQVPADWLAGWPAGGWLAACRCAQR